MDMQQGIALTLVTLAAVYLARNGVVAARAFFRNKSEGCGGCGKCAFAVKNELPKRPVVSGNIIPLGEVRKSPSPRSKTPL